MADDNKKSHTTRNATIAGAAIGGIGAALGTHTLLSKALDENLEHMPQTVNTTIDNAPHTLARQNQAQDEAFTEIFKGKELPTTHGDAILEQFHAIEKQRLQALRDEDYANNLASETTGTKAAFGMVNNAFIPASGAVGMVGGGMVGNLTGFLLEQRRRKKEQKEATPETPAPAR